MPGALFIINNVINGDSNIKLETTIETRIDIKKSIYIIFNKELTDEQKVILYKLARNREFYSNDSLNMHADMWTIDTNIDKFIFYYPYGNIQFPKDLIEMLDIKNTQIIKKIKYYYEDN